jgi:hypothetical protein
MSGRPPSVSAVPAPLRTEILKELQSLLEDREIRDRLDRGPLAEAKGREHWVLHLLLRAHELGQAHVSNLIGTVYANLLGRVQAVEEGFARLEIAQQRLVDQLAGRFDTFEKGFDDRLAATLLEARETVSTAVVENLDQKWKPVAESIDTFARSSHQLSKDLSDTYRVATQTRLLLNENARRMTDLGRDLVALEEGLKLALGKLLEERFQQFEERLLALEGRAPPESNGVPSAPTDSSTPP